MKSKGLLLVHSRGLEPLTRPDESGLLLLTHLINKKPIKP